MITQALAAVIPDNNERKERKKAHAHRVYLRKDAGDDSDDDETIESQADLMDDLADTIKTICSAKAQKDMVNNEIID